MLRRAIPTFGKHFRYVFSFGLARGLLFLSPLILANILPATDYGRIEWAQAAAMLVSTLLLGGAASVLPLVVHRRLEGLAEQHIARAVAAVAVLWSGTWLLASLMTTLVPELVLLALFTPVILLQTYISMGQKSIGRAGLSLWIETGFFVSLTLAVIAALLIFRRPWESVATAGLIVFGLVLFLILLRQSMQRPRVEAERPYRMLYRAGFPLMVASFVVIFAISSGRLGLGLLASPEAVGSYAVIYRVTFLPMIGHQLIGTAIFASLYRLESGQIDRLLVIVPASVTAVAVVLWPLLEVVGFLFGPAFSLAFAQHPYVGAVLVAQAVLLSGISINETICAREKVTATILPWSMTAMALLSAASVYYLIHYPMTLERYVTAHFLVLAGFYLTQIAVMRWKDVRLPRTYASYIGGTAVAFAFTRLV